MVVVREGRRSKYDVPAEVLEAQAGSYDEREWTFSWSVVKKTFHLREGELDLYVLSLEGYTEILEADGKTGRMRMRHALELDADGNARFVNEAARSSFEGAPAEARFVTNQMCFNRKGEDWRIWDKDRPRSETLEYVEGYAGNVYCFWPREDQGGHIFAAGHYEKMGGIARFA